jgi:hypothetical protein
LFVAPSVATTACLDQKKVQQMTKDPNTSPFPTGEKITNGYFPGNAFLTPLLALDKNNDFVLINVTFDPGARTNRSAVTNQ